MAEQKITRGNASQFFVAGELCRRGYSAVVTLGSTPNTDILCCNLEGTRFVFIQVKTFIPGGRTCSVGKKAERDYGENFFWVLAGIPLPESNELPEYFIIPSTIMSRKVKDGHQNWLDTPGAKGQQHNDSGVRAVLLPRKDAKTTWDIEEYRNRWDLIEEKLSEM